MRTVKIGELKEILQMEKAHFEYKKRDGTIRKAYGTLQYAFIPENLVPKESSTEPTTFKYFDLEKNAWRSISNNVNEVNVLSQ